MTGAGGSCDLIGPLVCPDPGFTSTVEKSSGVKETKVRLLQ